MCKHVAAVLYGIGARLDDKPELLFMLRGVDHEELIGADAEQAVTAATSRGKSKRLATEDLGAVFGIEIDAENNDASPGNAPTPNGQGTAAPKKVRAKKTNGKTKGKKMPWKTARSKGWQRERGRPSLQDKQRIIINRIRVDVYEPVLA